LPDGRRPNDEAPASRLLTATVLVLLLMGPPAHGQEQGKLPERPDEERPEEQPAVSVFDRPLWIGGVARVRYRYRRNLDLDDATPDDTLELNNRLQLDALYAITPRVLLFLRGRAVYEPTIELDSGDREEAKELQRRRHWLFVGDVLESVLGPGYSLQIGRQRLKDERRWWWNKDLDSALIRYDRPRVHLELAVAEELAPSSTETRFIDPDNDGILRTFGYAAWAWRKKQRLDFYLLYHFDHSGQHSIGQVVPHDRRDKSDAGLVWLGSRASGRVERGTFGDLVYGVDGAWVGGTERVFGFEDVDPGHDRLSSRSRHHVAGFAFDARATWATPAPARPALTLGYAFGSGDSNAKRGVDTGFRQTDLQSNRYRFLGVDRFRYYGELLRPELANLHIFTAALGIRVLRSSSVELVYHFYRQAVPAPFLRATELEAEPTGKSSLIGHEWDLVLGIQEWKHLQAELISALFRADRAFGSREGNLAQGVFLKVAYNFGADL
jgi:hypothetical protein